MGTVAVSVNYDVAQGLRQSRLSLNYVGKDFNSGSSCLHLCSTGIPGMYQCALLSVGFGLKPKESCVLGNRPPPGAVSLAQLYFLMVETCVWCTRLD